MAKKKEENPFLKVNSLLSQGKPDEAWELSQNIDLETGHVVDDYQKVPSITNTLKEKQDESQGKTT